MGNDTTLKLLCTGTPSVTDLFVTMQLRHKKLLYEHFGSLTALMMSNMSMNLLLARNAVFAFTGKLVYYNKNGAEVSEPLLNNAENRKEIASCKIDAI